MPRTPKKKPGKALAKPVEPIELDPDRPIWEKQKGETLPAFRNFVHYRDLVFEAGSRSIARASRDLSKSIATLSLQSRKYRWQERRDAYALHLDRRYREAREDEREQVDRRHAAFGASLEGAGMSRLRGDKENGVQALDLNELSAQDVVALIREGAKLSRQAHGLPTDLVRGAADIPAATVSRIANDLVNLSLGFIPDDRQALYIAAVKQYSFRS